MKTLITIFLIGCQFCILAQETAGTEMALHSLILTIRREVGEPTEGKVVKASVEPSILTKWASGKPSELKIPMRGPFLEHREAEDTLDQLLSAEANHTKNDNWNYLVGRLAGNGVGPNYSFFTLGKSVSIGKGVEVGVSKVTLKCDVTGPWMDGEPMTHSIYFLIPRSSLPKSTTKVRIVTEVTRVGDTTGDDEIVPPKYPPIVVVLEQDRAEQPATASELKSEGTKSLDVVNSD